MLPVIERLAATAGVPVSVDTAKAVVAREALAAGARMINDITALRGDPELAGVVAGSGADLCLMHMQGRPRTMQDDPRYEDVVAEVVEFLAQRVEVAVAAGIERERICVDPGIGFGKTVEHNLRLLRELDALCVLGLPVLVGVSRKRFLAAVTGADTDERLPGTIAANVLALERGAWIFRVHDVRPNRDALARRRRDRGGPVTPPLVVRIEGLEVFAHHGVHEHERRDGQPFLFDVELEPASTGAERTDESRTRWTTGPSPNAWSSSRRAARTGCWSGWRHWWPTICWPRSRWPRCG